MSNILLIKNNLTFLSPVELVGSSGFGLIRLTSVSQPYYFADSRRFFFVNKEIDASEEKIKFHLTSRDSIFYAGDWDVKEEPGTTTEVLPFNMLISKGWISDWMEWLGWSTTTPITFDIDQELLDL